MSYYIDLENITLRNYQDKLRSAYLPPSRMILKENLEQRFECFEKSGIKNVRELLLMLSKKDKFTELSNTNCLSDEYLIILLRELKSIHPKPNKLSDFSGIEKDTITNLEKIGITNTEKLYNRVIKKSDLQKFAYETKIKHQDLLKLAKLADLSRIKWVGVTYAQMLYELEVDTVKKVSQSDPVDLHKKLNALIKERNIFKGSIGLNDVKILIESAGELPCEI